MTYTLPLLALLVFFPSLALGADFVSLSGIPAFEEIGSATNVTVFLNTLYKLCIGAAAALAVLQIVRAGILYMGGDSVTEKKEAKDLIAMSLFGLLMVLSPVIVFGIINPQILELNIDVGGLESSGVTVQQAQVPGGGGNAANGPAFAQSCANLQFSGSKIDRMVAMSPDCCQKYGGTPDPQNTQQCNLTNLIDQDRFMLHGNGRAVVLFDNGNGVIEPQETSIHIATPGQGDLNSNRDTVAVYGFLSEASCLAARGAINNTNPSHIRSQMNLTENGKVEVSRWTGTNKILLTPDQVQRMVNANLSCTRLGYDAQ